MSELKPTAFYINDHVAFQLYENVPMEWSIPEDPNNWNTRTPEQDDE